MSYKGQDRRNFLVRFRQHIQFIWVVEQSILSATIPIVVLFYPLTVCRLYVDCRRNILRECAYGSWARVINGH